MSIAYYQPLHRLRAAGLAFLAVLSCLALGCKPSEQLVGTESERLVGTEIVPTLDTPLAESGNALWCATFQTAWNRVRDDIVGEPLRIANAQVVADRLNNSPVTRASLPPDSFYTAAGRTEDGIVETIRREMAEQYTGVQVPDFSGAAGFVTYGYLDTKSQFTTPFVDTEEPIRFTDPSGKTYAVSGFGLHQGTDWDLREKQAEQVKVLFSETDGGSDDYRLSAFALDLTADNAEQQVIVAVLPRAEHLRAALDDVAKRTTEFAAEEHYELLKGLMAIDSLEVPNVAFNIAREFAELQGIDKVIENPGEFQGLFILKAAQSIRFRLDKSGAVVISEAYAYPGAIPRDFIVDRPFLIVMKRRSSEEPYFVAWIENVELLDVD